jgi:hypothetical protein
MKKLTRISIDELRHEMSIISPKTQKEFLGGNYPHIQTITVTAYTAPGAQHYDSLSQFLYAQQTSLADAIASELLPTGVGILGVYISNQYSELAARIAAAGHSGAFYITEYTPRGNSGMFNTTFSAYDTKTGELITTSNSDFRY